MSKYIIVAETGSDIPRDLAEKNNIYLVPMHVSFGEEIRNDGTFSPIEVCEYYEKTGKLPKTSGCNPEDFIQVFNEIDLKYPSRHIIYMAYSSVTTCSYQSAKIAAENRKNITFLDTKQVSVGQCAAVMRLSRELDKHPDWSVEEVKAEAEKIINSVAMSFIPSNLDYLRAGGRVSNTAALCANILNIHPRIEIVDGYLKAGKKYRGKMKKVVINLFNDVIEEKNFDKDELWLGSSPGFSDDLKEEVIGQAYDNGFLKVHWVNVGGVITTHGGSNAFCITGYKK